MANSTMPVDMAQVRFPSTNLNSVAELVTYVTRNAAFAICLVGVSGDTGRALGTNGGSATVICKNIPSDNIINYMCFGNGNRLALGHIDTTNNSVTVEKTL